MLKRKKIPRSNSNSSSPSSSPPDHSVIYEHLQHQENQNGKNNNHHNHHQDGSNSSNGGVTAKKSNSKSLKNNNNNHNINNSNEKTQEYNNNNINSKQQQQTKNQNEEKKSTQEQQTNQDIIDLTNPINNNSSQNITPNSFPLKKKQRGSIDLNSEMEKLQQDNNQVPNNNSNIPPSPAISTTSLIKQLKNNVFGTSSNNNTPQQQQQQQNKDDKNSSHQDIENNSLFIPLSSNVQNVSPQNNNTPPQSISPTLQSQQSVTKYIPPKSSSSSSTESNRKTNNYNNNNKKQQQQQLILVPPLWVQGFYEGQDLQHIELEKEIQHFYDWLSPTDYENRLRQMIVNDIESIVMASWPHAKIKVFGSFSTNLCIPTSDIDIQISGINDTSKSFTYDPIRELNNTLCKKHGSTFTNIRLIASARVPIIKLVHRDTWYNIDICFDTPNGIENTKIIKVYLKKFKSMKLLLLILKFYLFQNNLNETYTGGIGSYALALMVVSFLQLRYVPYQQRVLSGPRKAKAREPFRNAGNDTDFGAMLIEFFELYGRSLQYSNHGISLEHGGYYYKKEPQYGTYLTLIDPQDPTNDVGKNSFNISFIRGAFTNALVKIVSSDFVNDKYPLSKYPTILSRIVEERLIDQMAKDRSKAQKIANQMDRLNKLPSKTIHDTKSQYEDNQDIDIKSIIDNISNSKQQQQQQQQQQKEVEDIEAEEVEEYVNNHNNNNNNNLDNNNNNNQDHNNNEQHHQHTSSTSSISSEEYSEELMHYGDSSSDVNSSSQSHPFSPSDSNMANSDSEDSQSSYSSYSDNQSFSGDDDRSDSFDSDSEPFNIKNNNHHNNKDNNQKQKDLVGSDYKGTKNQSEEGDNLFGW